MRVKEFLQQTPPEVLYHYTTQPGLLGILQNKTIWASHTQYLNDQREFRHAIEVVKRVLLNMQLGPDYGNERELLSEMEKAASEGIESTNVCVCSFSEAGDVLSQWRAYGGGSGGFSIGFSGQYLRGIADQERFWLAPCIYDERQQAEFVRTLLEDVLRENLAPLDGRLPVRPGATLVAYLFRYAPLLKHRSFSEEREWRIISRPINCTSERFDYRPGASVLIPFYKIPLDADGQPLGVRSVTVGPTPHREESVRAVRGLLVKHHLDNATVSNSDTPYRNW